MNCTRCALCWVYSFVCAKDFFSSLWMMRVDQLTTTDCDEPVTVNHNHDRTWGRYYTFSNWFTILLPSIFAYVDVRKRGQDKEHMYAVTSYCVYVCGAYWLTWYITLSVIPSRQVFPLTQIYILLSNKSQGPSYLCLPQSLLSLCVVDIWTRGLMLVQQAFLPTKPSLSLPIDYIRAKY